MTVLVAAASKHGGTQGIAERIGADLADCGLNVEVKKLHDVDEVGSYEAVVLGSAIFFGKWMKEAIQFVDAHAGELAERPTWLFASGSITGNPPIAEDKNAIRPSLVEKLLSSTHAREHKLFAGKLDRGTLSLAEKLPVKMARGREGDWRDLAAVDAWAAEIADALQPDKSVVGSEAMQTSGESG